jgi:hypothetical protein
MLKTGCEYVGYGGGRGWEGSADVDVLCVRGQGKDEVLESLGDILTREPKWVCVSKLKSLRKYNKHERSRSGNCGASDPAVGPNTNSGLHECFGILF